MPTSEAKAWRRIIEIADDILRSPSHRDAVRHAEDAKALAGHMLRQLDRGEHVNPRRNPPLLIIGNPPRGRSKWSNAVEEIRYRHEADGKWYKHEFDDGACLRGNRDGTVTIYRTDGRPVWEEFPG